MALFVAMSLAQIATMSALAAPTTTSEIIVTAPRELNEIPGGKFTTVIYPDSLPHSVVSVKEIIESTSGVYVSRSNSLEEEAAVSIRGFSSNQVKILINGVPIEEGGAASVNLASIPTALIDKIIVSRGPLSSQFGNGAMGGVINILTKRSVDKTKLALTYGSEDTIRVSGEASQNLSKHKLSLTGYANHARGNFGLDNPYATDLHDPSSPAIRLVSNNHTTEAGGEATFLMNEEILPASLTTSYSYRDKGVPGLLGQSFSHISEASHVARAKLQLSPFERKGADAPAAVSSYLNFTHRDYRDPNGERDSFPEQYLRRAWAGGLHAKPTLNLARNLVAPLHAAVDIESFHDANVTAERKSLALGARLEYTALDDRFIVSPSLAVSKATDLDTRPSYGLGLSYELARAFWIKASLNNGFRYPTFEELFLAKGIFVGNAELRPERTFGGELGVEMKVGWLTIEGGYFLYRTQDLIEYLLVSGFQYKPYNISEAMSEGLEISARADPATWITMSLGTTLQNVLNKESGSDYYDLFVPGRPRWYGTQSLELRPWKIFRVYTELTLALERYINKSNSKRLSDRYEWDAGVKLEPDEGLTVAFEVKNILSRNNIDIRGFPLSGRAFYGTLTKVF